MPLAPIIEPTPDALLTFEAAGKWGAWCFVLDATDAAARLHHAAHAGTLRVWQGEGDAPALVSLAEVACWQPSAPPGRVFDPQRAKPMDLPGPLRMRWCDARAALADELHARAPALTAEQAMTLAEEPADAWENPTGALKRLQTTIAQLVPSPTAQHSLVVVAVALNLVPVAERQADGSLVPIVLEPWQAWDLPGTQTASGDELLAGWNPLSWGWLHRVPWQADAEGPAVRDVPPPWAGWTVADWKQGPFLLHVPRLLDALRTLASDWARCYARGIKLPEIVEPLPLARRWTPAADAIADAGATARVAAIRTAIMAGALPVALRLPQRVTESVPPEDVPVPSALLPCLTLAERVDTGSFDWAQAVAIADADAAETATRATVVRMAPARRERDEATGWESVAVALRPADLVAALQAGKGNNPTAGSAKKAGTTGRRMSVPVQRAREALAAKLAADGAPEGADAPAELVRWFIEKLGPEARGASEANAKRHVAAVVRAHREAVASESQPKARATRRAELR